MRVRPVHPIAAVPWFVLSALVSGALLSSCGGGGSSVARSAEPVLVAAARGSDTDAQSAFGQPAPSGVRRTLSVPTCATPGPDAFVGGGSGNVAGGDHSVVTGGELNEACDEYSAVAGGEGNASSGSGVSYQNGFIGGGYKNIISGTDSFSSIVGGYHNTTTTLYAAIAGGVGNSSSGGAGSFIGAGGYNTATGAGSVIGGGYANSASGSYVTMPGGYVNSAAGSYSFAAGAHASAPYSGNFVWSDGSDGDA